MTLPARMGRVSYKVAGSYAYRGELILTKGIIYYFPLKDLKKSKPPDEGKLFGALVGGGLGGAISSAAANLGESVTLFQRPMIDLNSLFRSQPSEETLREALDAHIAEFKNFRPKSSDELPTPGHYRKDEVKNLVLTSAGRLKFETEFDEHVFKIGFIRKAKLKEALTESGFSL
ncbi:MAG: hypothetical protein M3444_04965 [Acidobacteriota bacterium]|nr:hypothetical protein [Acidobacteriota bacterium]MDQ5837587.1 hypothetical protein [Acidobacteriota bacterium]